MTDVCVYHPAASHHDPPRAPHDLIGSMDLGLASAIISRIGKIIFGSISFSQHQVRSGVVNNELMLRAVRTSITSLHTYVDGLN